MLEHTFDLGDEALEASIVEGDLPIVVDLKDEVDDFGSGCAEVVCMVGHADKTAETRAVERTFEGVLERFELVAKESTLLG